MKIKTATCTPILETDSSKHSQKTQAQKIIVVIYLRGIRIGYSQIMKYTCNFHTF